MDSLEGHYYNANPSNRMRKAAPMIDYSQNFMSSGPAISKGSTDLGAINNNHSARNKNLLSFASSTKPHLSSKSKGRPQTAARYKGT